MTIVHTQSPGKLVLFGEYAVLEGHEALVASVTRYARCRIEPHTHFVLDAGRFGKFVSSDLDRAPVFAAERCQDRVLSPIRISLDSDDFYQSTSPTSEKLGLGSSAAVSTALSAALHEFDNNRYTPSELFVEAHRLHKRVQGVGSGADIAAACFGGAFIYQCQTQSMRANRSNETVTLPLDEGTATLRRLPMHTLGSLLGVYLGRGASTPELVGEVQRYKALEPNSFEQMMNEIGAASRQAAAAWLINDRRELAHCAHATSRILDDLGMAAGCDIIPPSMKTLNRQLKALSAVGKTTGAGGGDMAWVICEDDKHQQHVERILSKDWELHVLKIADEAS